MPARASRILYGSAIAIAVVGLAVMLGVYPFAFDDFVYMRCLGITADGLPDTIDLDVARRHLAYRFHCDNMRLANMAATLVLATPKWLSGTASALLFGWAMVLMGRMAGLRAESWRGMALLSALLIFLLPWFDSMAATDYQLNYLWGTALWALAMWLFLRPAGLNIWIGIAVGLVTGLWHEGLSGPALAGLGLVWLTSARYRTAGRTALLVGLLAGIAMLAAVPGTRARMGLQSSPWESYNLLRTAIAMIPAWLFFATSAVSALCGDRPVQPSPSTRQAAWTAMAGACLGGLAVKLVGDDFRAAWAAGLAGCCGIVLVAHSWPAKGRLNTIANAAAVLLLAATAAHLALADALAFDARREYRAVVAHQQSDNFDDVLWLDLQSPVSVPAFALGKPLWSMWRWTPYEEYFGIPAERIAATRICPPALRLFDPSQATDTLPCGIWLAGPHMVRPAASDTARARLEEYIVSTPLASEPVPVHVYPFRSEADGRTYEYLFPTLAPPYLRPVLDLRPTGRQID